MVLSQVTGNRYGYFLTIKSSLGCYSIIINKVLHFVSSMFDDDLRIDNAKLIHPRDLPHLTKNFIVLV